MSFDIEIKEEKEPQIGVRETADGLFKVATHEINIFENDVKTFTDFSFDEVEEEKDEQEHSMFEKIEVLEEKSKVKAKKKVAKANKSSSESSVKSEKNSESFFDFSDFVETDKKKSGTDTAFSDLSVPDESVQVFSSEATGKATEEVSKKTAEKALEKSTEKVVEKTGEEIVADTAAAADPEPVSKVAIETIKVAKDVVETTKSESEIYNLQDDDEKKGVSKLLDLKGFAKPYNEKSENETVYSHKLSLFWKIIIACWIFILFSNMWIIKGGLKLLIVREAGNKITSAYVGSFKKLLNKYDSIFSKKSSYSGTGKAINITTYTDTTERQWVEKYCKKYNMQGWEEVCLAICMTESGGKENSNNPMGVTRSNRNNITGFFSGTTEAGIDAGVEALYDCAGIYEYFIGKKAEPTDTDCILIVVSCYEQGIDFARFVSAHYKGKYSDKALDEYAIEKNNEGANNMFYGSYCLNGSDGTDTLGGRTVPPIYNNFLKFFDLTAEQATDDPDEPEEIEDLTNYWENLHNLIDPNFVPSTSGSLAEIAQKELGNYGNKYWDWCHSPQVDWCGIFVSWCAEQAGLSKEVPFSMSAGMIDNLDQSKVKDESYTPKAGDLITFDDTPPYKVSHIAIVSRVEGGRVYYIGGNQGEGDSSRNTGAWCSYSIVSESSIPIGDSGVYKYYAFG